MKLVLTPIYDYIPESDIRRIMDRVSNLDTLEEACGKLIVNLMRELCQKDSDAMNNDRPTDFALSDIKTISAFDNAFKQRCIQQFQAGRGFVHLANGRIRLTQVGREHCYEYN
jgi:hypothetical protein